jgi:riboflavin transporter FmnP
MSEKNRTVELTGTAILAALVIIFDYSLKYSGLKIPFPWYPNLKFDFTGIPIALSLFLYGYSSSIFTSFVAGVGIVARSGNVISAAMKVFAELSTVIGLHIGQNVLKKKNSEYLSWALGLVTRVFTMSVVNLYVLPNVYGVPYPATRALLPLIGFFNIIQGLITITLGHFLYIATRKRLPQWIL